MTKICCVCNRVEQGKDWTAHYAFTSNERVTHGYCPVCFNTVMDEITAFVSDRQGPIQLVKQQTERGVFIPACA